MGAGVIAIIIIAAAVLSNPKADNQQALASQTITSTNYAPNETNKEDDIYDAEIIFHEWGYTYSNNGDSSGDINVTDSADTSNEEYVYEGDAENKTETILQWDEAQNTLEADELYWLDNEFLKSYADNIYFVTSDSNIKVAYYETADSRVKVYLYTMEESDGWYEFGTTYTSELYNIREIGEDKKWQCYSFNGYDGTEYTSAVISDNNIICEIIFKNCGEEFIGDTIAEY